MRGNDASRRSWKAARKKKSLEKRESGGREGGNFKVFSVVILNLGTRISLD